MNLATRGHGSEYRGLSAHGYAKQHNGDVYNNTTSVQHESSFFNTLTQDDRKSRLLLAAEHGQVRRLELLINAYADLDHKDEFGNTPLHITAGNGDEACTKLLLSHRADDSAKNSLGKTPFLQAAAKQQYRSCKLIAASMSQMSMKRTFLNLMGQSGDSTPLGILLDQGLDLDAKDEEGLPLLNYAVWIGHSQGVRPLINFQANLEAKDRFGSTPLLLAAEYGYGSILQDLLDSGANLQVSNVFGHNVMWFVVRSYSQYTVQHLLDTCRDPKVRTEIDLLALAYAAFSRMSSMVELVLESGVEVDKLGPTGRPTLREAVIAGHKEIVTTLLDHGAGLESRDIYGETALWQVLESPEEKREVMGELLLGRGAHVDTQDQFGDTPPLDAVCRNEESLVKVLLRYGASTRFSNRHAIEFIDRSEDLDSVRFVDDKTKSLTLLDDMLRFLLCHGLDINQKYRDGWTLLHRAASDGTLGRVKLLCDLGADVEVMDDLGRTAMDTAREHGHTIIADTLDFCSLKSCDATGISPGTTGKQSQ